MHGNQGEKSPIEGFTDGTGQPGSTAGSIGWQWTERVMFAPSQDIVRQAHPEKSTGRHRRRAFSGSMMAGVTNRSSAPAVPVGFLFLHLLQFFRGNFRLPARIPFEKEMEHVIEKTKHVGSPF